MDVPSNRRDGRFLIGARCEEHVHCASILDLAIRSLCQYIRGERSGHSRLQLAAEVTVMSCAEPPAGHRVEKTKGGPSKLGAF